MTSFVRQILKLFFLGILIFVLGGLGGVIFDRFVLPTLSVSRFFSGTNWLGKLSERTTIINKTEQVVVREDDSVEKIVAQPATAVVNIVSVSQSLAAAASSTVVTRTGVLLTNDGLIVTYANEEARKREYFFYRSPL
ncbi:MAG: hypothetical protein WDN67_05575 [Candidatus Moraniibacteriota bacterium]